MKRITLYAAGSVIIGAMLLAGPAHAMHISEGILPLGWAALWFAVAAPFLALGIRRVNELSRHDLSFKPLVGLMAAVVFIISCMPIPVPTAGTCSHPCGTGIAAILVGPLVSVVITTVALLIQALFLAHGGLSTLGADVVSMGVAGSFAGWFVFRGMRRLGAGLAVAAFVAGLLADWATYLTTALELSSGVRGSEPFYPLFLKIVAAFVPTQLPLGVLEGAMTAGMVVLLHRKRPDLLAKMGVVDAGGPGAGPRRATVVMLALFCLLASLLVAGPSRASEKWPGVDETVVEKIAAEHGREPRDPLINTDQGDLLLFVFLLAGTVGGFAAGYFWRMLVAERRTYDDHT
ncbi:energy-coupling factor ABC transporter permease [Geobacter sulfurreducens]|uniref:energy-coupling factor ABC transporter permease n=1 Tax=Geobacter sulfurreducens TaxID=35554 RepID=UPI0001D8F16B|nr:energy-coupling factor ABC transporter permease [Geobacter sulfurreducens]ADI85759.1 cobalt ABC transporter, membrane protein CbiMN [Geobacter sulfurreducens KN400]UTG92319.1 energy-coupling factor ABC transporter permease [Geobacter sulfurreducens]